MTACCISATAEQRMSAHVAQTVSQITKCSIILDIVIYLKQCFGDRLASSVGPY